MRGETAADTGRFRRMYSCHLSSPRWRSHARSMSGLWASTFLILSFLLGIGEVQARQEGEGLDVHAQRVMIRGLTWLQNGYPDRAAAIYSEGLKVHPDNPALLASMATAQQAMGSLGAARFYLDQALRVQPALPALVSQDLDLAVASGDLAAISRAANRLLALEDLQPSFLLRHLDVLIEGNAASVGAVMAESGIRLFPGHVAVLSAGLRVFSEQGNLDAALRCAEALVDVRGSVDDRTTLIRLLMQRAEWDRAADLAVPLATEEGDDPELLKRLSDLDARLSDRDLAAETGLPLAPSTVQPEPVAPEDSLRLFRSAWEADPSREASIVALVGFLMRSERAREAALLVDEHIRDYPRHLQVWPLTMETWLAAGHPETALERSEEAMMLFPGFPPVVLSRARVLAATGERAEAIGLIDELLARVGKDSNEGRAALRLQHRLRQQK